jgi:hypothetical protein
MALQAYPFYLLNRWVVKVSYANGGSLCLLGGWGDY